MRAADQPGASSASAQTTTAPRTIPVRDLTSQTETSLADRPSDLDTPLPPAVPVRLVNTRRTPADLAAALIRCQAQATSSAAPVDQPADAADSTAALTPPAGASLMAHPNALLAQQKVPEPNPESLKQIYKILSEQMGLEAEKAVPTKAPASTVPALPNITAAKPAAASQAPEVVPTPSPQKPRAQIQASTNGEGDQRLQIYFPETDIRDILDSLSAQGNLNILASKSVQGKLSLRLTNVDVEGALDAVLRATGLASRRDGQFIFVGSPEEFNTMEQSADRVGTRIYRPNYVSSAELQTLIQPILTERVGVVGVSSPAEAGIAADAASAGGYKFAGGDVLMVRDYEAVLAQVDQIVAEVDVRPMQVAIEAMILSVKLNDTDTLGVNWDLLRDKKHLRFAIGMPDTTLPTTFTTGGLNFAFLDSNLGAFIEALQEYNETDVIATPRIMVINKQRAEIQIGRQQGYVTSTVTETSTTQTVQMMDTGTILRLRPFISSDGLIRVEVHPELSTGEVVEKGDVLVPDKELTQVTTNVMVRDGCTVVLGGLFRDEVSNDVNQVPVLGSLPVIGALFRNRTDKTTRHEILVLLTPHIIYEPESCQEGDKAACEFHRRQAVVTEKMSPWNRHNISRKYVRLAQNAWAVGDRESALRYAELAVQFDPQFRTAIDLRATIWQNAPQGKHTLPTAALVPEGHPLDGQEIAGWVLDDLEHNPAPPPTLDHPLDPGRNGSHRDIVRPRKLP